MLFRSLESIAKFNDYVKEKVTPKFPLEVDQLKKELNRGRKMAMNSLNSLTISNAPPEKLIDMRNLFDDKVDEII